MMTSARRLLQWLILLLLLFAAPAAGADESTSRVGILHSLSGTIAISKRSPDERSDIREPILIPAYRCAHAGYLL
jgi:hypothetical protein